MGYHIIYLICVTQNTIKKGERKEKEKKMCTVNTHECIKDSENEWIGKWVKRQTKRQTGDR